MRTARNHAHPVCIYQQRSNYFGCPAARTLCTGTCKVECEQLGKQSTCSIPVNSIRAFGRFFLR